MKLTKIQFQNLKRYQYWEKLEIRTYEITKDKKVQTHQNPISKFSQNTKKKKAQIGWNFQFSQQSE